MRALLWIKEKINFVLEKPLLTSTLVLLVLAFFVIGFSLPYYLWDFENFMTQLMAEAHGMLFDIAVIGILLFWLNKSSEIRQMVRSYKEEIDDFRLWESDEGAFRTVGNIKRLNRHGIYKLDLVQAYLPKTNLNYLNLSGSNLNSANLSHASMVECNLKQARMNQTNLENTNLNQACLKKTYGGGANFKDAFLIKTDFSEAFLIKSNFENAYLMEANLNGAHLAGANLDQASLYKADLRKTEGLTIEQLAKAKTLYKALLDPHLRLEAERMIPELLGLKKTKSYFKKRA